MSAFFSDKMRDSDQATLARVVYHTIVKQHVAVVAANVERREIEAERQVRMAKAAPAPPVSAPFPEPVASPVPDFQEPNQEELAPPPLTDQVEQPVVKRVIKLDL